MLEKILMPQLGLTMEEGEVQNWRFAEGESFKAGDVLADIITDKLTNDLEAPRDGVMVKIIAQEGEFINVKGTLCIIGDEGQSYSDAEIEKVLGKSLSNEDEVNEEVKAEPVSEVIEVKTKVSVDGRVKISPFAKKVALKNNIDYSTIAGSGPRGRIVHKDILKAIESGVTSEKTVSAPKVQTQNFDGIELLEGDEVIKLSGMRKSVARNMTESQLNTPTVTQDIKVDVTNLVEFRKKINESRNSKITLNDFIIKATAKALTRKKKINVSFYGDSYIQRKQINIGVAVSVPDGLIVPVIRNADQKSLETISLEAKDLSTRAREGSLNVEEYQGSTFTISNLGMYQISSFTPIINQPNSGILGVNTVEDVLYLDQGEVKNKKVMTLSFTFDHRTIDGALAAEFEVEIKNILENPIEILL